MTPPWWGLREQKFLILTTLDCWKRHFREQNYIENYFYLLKSTKSTKTTSQKCWRNIFWVDFFGCPYWSNDIKTGLGLPIKTREKLKMALWMWKKFSLVVGFLAYFACCFFVFGPPFLYVNSKPAWYKPYWISNFSKCSLINENENTPLKQKRLKVNNAGFITKDMWKVIIEEIATNRPQNLGVTIGLLPYCFPGVSLRWMIFCYPPLLWK